jgi:hypothetical protein
VRIYDDRGTERERPSSRDLFVFGGVVGTPTAAWRVVLGPAVHTWSVHSGAVPSDDTQVGAGAMVRAARLFSLPSAGPDLSTVPAVAGELLWLDRYRRADLTADLQLELGAFVVRPRAGAGWGDGLPLPALFTLGGTHSFPGLRMDERRGDQVAFASLAVLRRLRGPVYLRAEIGRGRTALVRARTPAVLAAAATSWVSGGEFGLAADTPIGPVLVGYGIASNGRPVLRIRLGS